MLAVPAYPAEHAESGVRRAAGASRSAVEDSGSAQHHLRVGTADNVQLCARSSAHLNRVAVESPQRQETEWRTFTTWLHKLQQPRTTQRVVRQAIKSSSQTRMSFKASMLHQGSKARSSISKSTASSRRISMGHSIASNQTTGTLPSSRTTSTSMAMAQ